MAAPAITGDLLVLPVKVKERLVAALLLEPRPASGEDLTSGDLADLQRVIRYLQREIREGRRNVGALKLSNLLQVDRFEEDLNISRVQLYAPKDSPPAPSQPAPPLPPQEKAAARQRAAQILARFRAEQGW